VSAKIDDVRDKVISTKVKEVVIDLRNERFEGDVLDVGMENFGVVYHMCKHTNDEISIDYIDKNLEEISKDKHWYDTAVLFFALSKIFLDITKRKLLMEVWDYLKEDGEILIWDLDKSTWQYKNMNVKVLLPGEKSKLITLKDFNLLKDSSKEYIFDLLEPMFEILECNASDNIYYIRGRKKRKGRTEHESSIDGGEC
jgi:hypothetical protein